MSCRQTFPRWSIRPVAPHQAPRTQARTATLIALPVGRARSRRVVTYPATILVPDRSVPPPMGAEPVVCPTRLLALLAPSLLLGLAMVLAHVLA